MNKRTSPKRLKLQKKNQTQILEVKNSVNEAKSELTSLGNIADQMKERIMT